MSMLWGEDEKITVEILLLSVVVIGMRIDIVGTPTLEISQAQ
jgi:hypothetical protein